MNHDSQYIQNTERKNLKPQYMVYEKVIQQDIYPFFKQQIKKKMDG